MRANELIEELVRVGYKPLSDTRSSSLFLNSGRQRAREIGEELNRIGGNEQMLMAHAYVSERLGWIAARQLEAAWGGIGEWLS